MFRKTNPNPNGMFVEDCVIRAIAIATNRSWDDIFFHVCLQAYIIKNMPSVDTVWGSYLENIGFVNYMLPTTCKNCYTVRDFCYDNPIGTFILATGSHAVCVIDGDYYDAWDSGDEMPRSVWRREINADL